jgi:hypothetical protein
LIDQLGHGDVTEDGHADDGPDQASHGHAASVQGNDALLTELGSSDLGGMRLESDSKLALWLAWKKSRACVIRIKNPKLINRFRIFTHKKEGPMASSLIDIRSHRVGCLHDAYNG